VVEEEVEFFFFERRTTNVERRMRLPLPLLLFLILFTQLYLFQLVVEPLTRARLVELRGPGGRRGPLAPVDDVRKGHWQRKTFCNSLQLANRGVFFVFVLSISLSLSAAHASSFLAFCCAFRGAASVPERLRRG